PVDFGSLSAAEWQRSANTEKIPLLHASRLLIFLSSSAFEQRNSPRHLGPVNLRAAQH
ncbi:uncharacterized, partial [Tachysurus ichikawai]